MFACKVHYDDSADGKTRELAYAQLLSCYKLATGIALSAFQLVDSIRSLRLDPPQEVILSALRGCAQQSPEGVMLHSLLYDRY